MNKNKSILALIAVAAIFLCELEVACAQNSKSVKILALGDSLTEGYGLAKEQSFPSLLEVALRKKGYSGISVINAGTSGSTSASAIKRLNWQLRAKPKPTILILALGANDGLRGVDPESTFNNLGMTIEAAQKSKMKVLLVGMMMPPNYGAQYTKDFAAVFPRLRKKYDLSMMPFLLTDVAGNKKLNLPDGIHPNAAGYQIITKNLIKYLEPMLAGK